ncbi:hypothetical protein FV218_10950 [Methylobacterium sp. WL69]|uniref:hypothetical protein n=1 Tax=Methylobacterium sp. WL69 TaxID=2603893 RepID=UPI0011CAEBB0|nr:hypothetical protein [Methylobacterium sp. WL69]TXM73724.1 hypothetical protein FV218_10950 [Methylobacterium sp. WL69]
MQRLYRDENTKRFLDWIADNGYTGRDADRPSGIDYDGKTVSEVAEFEKSELEELDLSRAQVVSIMKEMAAKKLGDFVLGRRESKSRFVWSYEPLSVAACAQGRAAEPVAIIEEDDIEEDGSPMVQFASAIPHQGRSHANSYALHVRDGEVTIALPQDVSRDEAEQVATYLEGVASLIRSTLIRGSS